MNNDFNNENERNGEESRSFVLGGDTPAKTPEERASAGESYSSAASPSSATQSTENSSGFDPKNPYNSPYMRGYASGGSSSYAQGAYSYSYPESNGGTRKKEKRPASRAFVVWMVILAIVLSGFTSFTAASIAVAGKKYNSDVTINQITKTDSQIDNMTEANRFAKVAAAVSDSVVEVTTETVTTGSYFGQYITKGAGSGVIISDDGYIITCAHVIEGSTTISVRLTDGTDYTASLVGSDSETDIAVIKIDAKNLKAATFGDSDKLVVGQDAIAVGNPLGELGGTVTTGIISAKDREVEIDGTKYTLLQTNAAVNPGNSGGGLFDIDGNLIGIVNAKSSGSDVEGLAFAIPGNKALDIATSLISDGYIKGRPKLGFELFEITSSTDLSKYFEYRNYITDYGVYIASSESTDFKKGDRLVAIDKYQVSSITDVKSMLSEYSVGDRVEITVSRVSDSGKSQILTIGLTLTEKKS